MIHGFCGPCDRRRMIALARRTLHAVLAGGLAAAVVWTAGVPAEAAVAATVSVDFTKPIRTIAPTDFGIGITGYGEGSYITNNTQHRDRIRALGAGRIRIELHYQEPGN